MLEHILLGGYTKNNSKGLYKSSLNTRTGEMETPEEYIPLSNPTYFDVGHNQVIYTSSLEDGVGGVAAFDISDPDKPHKINSSLKPETSQPAYVYTDEKKGLVYSTGFHEGKVFIDKITEDKGLELLYTITLTGSSVKPEQEASHPHYSANTPDDKLIICDYGTDKVSIFDVTMDQEPKLLSEFDAPAGSAPRHLVFHPTLNIAYVICELSSEVLVLNYNQDDHTLEQVTKVSTIPAGESTGENLCAAIRISSDGKFLYASNRGHNSITVFEISDNGLDLTMIQTIYTEGEFPRDFMLDKTEEFIVCPNLNSNNLTLFERDKLTGLLKVMHKDIQVPESTCVKFI